MSDATPRAMRGRVVFDRSVYDLDIIKKSAYRFMGRFIVDIRQNDAEIICDLDLDEACSEKIEDLIAEFRNEILDQDLRRALALETAPFRNAILALAFAQSEVKVDE